MRHGETPWNVQGKVQVFCFCFLLPQLIEIKLPRLDWIVDMLWFLFLFVLLLIWIGAVRCWIEWSWKRASCFCKFEFWLFAYRLTVKGLFACLVVSGWYWVLEAAFWEALYTCFYIWSNFSNERTSWNALFINQLIGILSGSSFKCFGRELFPLLNFPVLLLKLFYKNNPHNILIFLTFLMPEYFYLFIL